MLVTTTDCGVAGIAFYSKYLKQNFAQLIQYVNRYQDAGRFWGAKSLPISGEDLRF